MRMQNRAARRYLREVRSWLPCSRKLKRGILEKIGSTIAEYLSEEPGADYNKLLARFGTPQQIAASYVNEMKTGELLRDLRIKRRIVYCVAITAAIIVLLWASVVTRAYLRHVENVKGYYIDEVGVIQEIIENE